VEEFGNLAQLPGDLETAATAAKSGLDRNRQSIFLGEGDNGIGIVDRLGSTGNEGSADLLRDVASSHLVAQRLDGIWRWADPDDPSGKHCLGKGCVFSKETVARVDRIGLAARRNIENLCYVEVGLRGSRAALRIRLIGGGDEQRSGILAGGDS